MEYPFISSFISLLDRNVIKTYTTSLSTIARLTIIKSTRKFHLSFHGFSVIFDRSSTSNVIMAKCNYLARHDAFAPSLSLRSLRKYIDDERGTADEIDCINEG